MTNQHATWLFRKNNEDDAGWKGLASILEKIMMDIKQLIAAYTNIHIPSKTEKNIIIISTPRSGSTWLMELIATQPGFKKISEPFNFRKSDVKKHLEITSWDTLYDPVSLHRIESYLKGFLTGRLRFKNTKPWETQYRPFTNRLVFKILHGFEDRIEFLSKMLNAKIVILIRHPIPVSISRQEYPRIDTFLNSQYSKSFTKNQLAYAQKINQQGSKMERGMLSWCLQNYVPLRDKTDEWIMITYEQLVMEPDVITDYLCRKLNFQFPDKILKRLDIASNSINQSTDETRQKIREKEKRWLIEKWRKQVDVEEEQKLMNILKIFQMDIYVAGKYMAQKKNQI